MTATATAHDKTAIFDIKSLSFAYGQGGARRKIFDDVDFTILAGESVAILGPSGSGKSTLFYMLGCMLRPDKGVIRFKDQDVLKLDDFRLSLFRNRHIGFIFQQFHLLQRANVLSNILLPTRYPVEVIGEAGERALKRAQDLAVRMGLADCLTQLPSQLSGGQQQRVAIARALMNDVDVILADEPTGNLDSVNAKVVLEILADLQKEGKTIIIITHDRDIAAQFDRQLHVKDGKIFEGGEPTKTIVKPPTPRPNAKTPLKMQNPWLVLARLLPMAAENMSRNRLRSLLTMIGVVIGVGAVVAMLTLGNFTQQRILEGYESLGVNRLVIYGYQNWGISASQKRSIQFSSFNPERDLLPLKQIFPQINLLSPILNAWDVKVSYNGKTYSDSVVGIGVNHEYFGISNAEIAEGDMFSAHHVDLRSSVCVVGAEVPKQLGAIGQLVGEVISVGKDQSVAFPCRVIGVLASQKSAIEWFQPDKQVLMPYTYLQAHSDIWRSRIQTFTLNLKSGSDVERSARQIKGFFDLKYDGTGDFRVDSNTTLVAQMKRFLNIFALLLVGIASLTLLVGGIGIQNMMLVSITDRLKEIGLRKALGATNRSIRQQILIEAMLLCSAAGIFGLIAGIGSCMGLLYIATQIIPDLKFEVILDPTAIAVSGLSIVAVGILSGLAPAIKAERLQVIEALRAE